MPPGKGAHCCGSEGLQEQTVMLQELSLQVSDLSGLAAMLLLSVLVCGPCRLSPG